MNLKTRAGLPDAYIKTTVVEGLNALTTLINTTLSIGDSKLIKPVQPSGLCKKLWDKLDINIPKEIKSVATFWQK